MTKALKLAALSTLTALSVGCSNAQDQTQMKQSAASKFEVTEKKQNQYVPVHQSHKKLSASIDITHDFKGRAILGTSQTINLDVVNNYGGGSAVIEVLPANGLRVFNNTGFAEPTAEAGGMKSAAMTFAGAAPQNLSLHVQPLTEGVHNITLLAKVNLPDGQFMTRSFVIPVYVGEKFQPTKESLTASSPAKEPVVSGGLAIMDAEETIKD